jgi:VCBS repeat-containing protein
LAVVLVLAATSTLAISASGSFGASPHRARLCLGLPVTLPGTPGDDHLRGTRGDDVIAGLGGDDRIIGGGGLDVICGGPGRDVITTGAGPDKVAGGPGADSIHSRRGPDILYGDKGDDFLNGGPARDLCSGGAGRDVERFCEGRPPASRHPTHGDNPPGAVGDTATTDEDTATTIAVLANDSDPDGDPLTVDGVNSYGTRGGVSVVSSGKEVEFDPRGRFDPLRAGQTAGDSFVYTVGDGRGLDATATVAVTVTGVDDAPTEISLSKSSLKENEPGGTEVGAFSTTDVDAGDTFAYSLVGGEGSADNGSFEISGEKLRAKEEFDFEARSSYSIRVKTVDSGGKSFEKQFTITVEDLDDPPVAVNDTKTVEEDSGATAVDVLANDTDVDGGPKSIESLTQPANGTAVITGGGTGLTYEPDANYCNEPPGTTPDTFEYELNGGSIASVSVKVDCVDDAPVAVNDTKTVEEDSGATAIDVLANDTDIDGGPKSIESLTQPAKIRRGSTGGGR